jgi:ABC-type transport system involved in multi-copper enzyme maturation permease subunit
MIAAKTFRELRIMALVYLGILELLLIPVILLWPDLYADLQRSSLLRNFPIDVGRKIGEGISNRNEDIAYLNWMAVMLFFRSVNLAGIAASVLFGTALFAREREASTLEFLLARPVSRARILWSKSWPTALCVVLPIFVANLTAIPWSWRIGIDLPLQPLLLASVHGAMFVLCILAATTWVSVLCRAQAHVAFWIGGVTVVQIGLYLTQRLRRISLFRLSDFEWYGPILTGNTGVREMFDPIHGAGLTTWLLAAIVLFYALALRALQRLEL